MRVINAACAFRRNKKLNLVIWGVGNKRQFTWHLEGFKWLNKWIFWWGSSDKISKFISVLANKTKARVWAQVVIHTVYLLARFLVIFFFFFSPCQCFQQAVLYFWLVGWSGRESSVLWTKAILYHLVSEPENNLWPLLCRFVPIFYVVACHRNTVWITFLSIPVCPIKYRLGSYGVFSFLL